MLNIGLRDRRKKKLIISSVLRMNANGNSSISMSFGGIPVYISMESTGESSASITIVSVELLSMVSNGESTATMRFLKEPLEKPIVDIVTFDSIITTEASSACSILTIHEGNSQITIITDDKSIIQ